MDATITREQAVDVLKTVFDPEIPVSVWDLGLIYTLDLDGGDVAIKMTLTAPGCPVGPQIAAEIEQKMKVVGAENVAVGFVWSPPWTAQRATEEGKLHLLTLGIPV